MRSGPIGAIVLAAGRSTRFGGSKLLASFRGRPLVAHAFAASALALRRGLTRQAFAVVGPGDAAIAALAREAGLHPEVNQHPDDGLSGSLRLGVSALAPDIDGALVLLGDQPLVRIEVLESLAAAWREGDAAAVRPRYAEAPAVPGHPVILDRSLWPLLERLRGDAGLSSLATGIIETATVDVPGNNPDIDTPADLHRHEGSPS
jgi:molybdenum cofactor cytidylyltransferase